MCRSKYVDYKKSNSWLIDKYPVVLENIKRNKLYLLSEIAKNINAPLSSVKRFVLNQPLFRAYYDVTTLVGDCSYYYKGSDIIEYFEKATRDDSMNELLSDYFTLDDNQFKSKYNKTKSFVFVNGSNLVIKCHVDCGHPKFYIG